MNQWLEKLADRMLEFLWPVCILIGIPILLLLTGLLLMTAIIVLCQSLWGVHV